MQFDVELVSALNQYIGQEQNPRHHLSPEYPEPFMTPTHLWPNEVRSIGVWARITLAVCVVADPLIGLRIDGAEAVLYAL
jgi:hypothetical protein